MTHTLQQFEGESAVADRENHRAEGADRTRFAGCCDSEQNRSLDHGNQKHRRQETLEDHPRVFISGYEQQLGRQAWSDFGFDLGIYSHEQKIEEGKYQSRNDCGHEHIADRNRHQVGHDDEHDTRWDQDAERARGCDAAAG